MSLPLTVGKKKRLGPLCSLAYTVGKKKKAEKKEKEKGWHFGLFHMVCFYWRPSMSPAPQCLIWHTGVPTM